MKTRAAVAWEANRPLAIEEVELEGPRQGEVLVRNVATGVCHTDAYTLLGEDSEGLFPTILGHESGAVVEEIGTGVMSVKPGDHVIPLYTPECGECEYCRSGKTNLCQAIRATQGRGVMPDGTSRFSLNGKPIYHYMGTSTFSEYTVLPEIAVARINKEAPLDKICLLACGVTTGIGAVLNTAKVELGQRSPYSGLAASAWLRFRVRCWPRRAASSSLISTRISSSSLAQGDRHGQSDAIRSPDSGGNRRVDPRWCGLFLRMCR